LQRIKPKRTGMIVFLSRIFSVGTGFVFLVMITRWLNPQQFGLWEFILDVVVFSSYPVGLVTYWATREVARGNKVGRSTIQASVLMSLAGVAAFLLIAYSSHDAVNSPLAPFIAASFLVPLNYWSLSASSLVQGYDPAITGYSLFFSETVKVVSAFFLLFDLRLRIFGVIIAVCLSYFTQALISTLLLRETFEPSFDSKTVKRWLRDSYVPAISMLNYVLAIADTFVASIGQGNTVLAGYFQAAFQIATVVGYSGYLASALYPLLLQNKHQRIVTEIIDYTMMFAIPMAVGSIALGQKILFLLSPLYVESFYSLSVLSVASVLNSFSNILDQTLLGVEKADLKEENRVYSILRSNLTFVPLSNLLYSVCYIATVFIIGRISSAFTPGFSSFQWAVSQLLLLLILVSAKLTRVKKQVRLSFPLSLLKYFGVSILMGFVVYFLSLIVLPFNVSTLSYSLRLFSIVITGAVLYFGILFFIDRSFRKNLSTFISSLLS
jgi:O-antigen/teichoic acid export membrane protein